ncbi:MAG: orotidine-5'-phosphate decarboxylase [Bacteroidetes bacterium]|nr:orotidine-5'-phosphate decarboxylase [Bacteroidota bacterium]
MKKQELIDIIKQKKSFLCVGLDTDMTKIPRHLLDAEDPIFEFNREIIDATLDVAVAYKPNLAFYEAMGINGLLSLERTVNYLEAYHNEVFLIADAKRGDIGNTSQQYARAFLSKEGYNFDAITVAPYMGEDSVKPFLSYPEKWVVVLALTSNKGAFDFQLLETENKRKLYEEVLIKTQEWGTSENMMYVVGATQARILENIRNIVPGHFLLVPGVGAQGGSLAEVCHYGMNKDGGLLINASRSILYASNKEDFALKAAEEAFAMQSEMEVLMKKHF